MPDFLQESNLERALKINRVFFAAYDFDASSYKHVLFNKLEIPFPESLHKAVRKRQAEFLAGRCAAKRALATQDTFIDDIGIGLNRSPIWPKGFIGSLTHTDKTAICAIATSNDMAYLGIDLESIITLSVADEMKNQIIDLQEEQLLQKSHLPFNEALTLALSAKESLFKALHPYVKSYFDFKAARVKSLCAKTQTIELELTKDLTTTFIESCKISGKYVIDADNVFTSIYARL